MFMLIVLKSINVFKIEDALLLIMKSIELLISCIHFIFVIFRRSYDCRRFITFIIKRFFCVVSSLTKQSYNDFESMQNIKNTKWSRIADNVVLKTASRSESWANAYNSATKMLRVTHLHLIDDQWTILTCFEFVKYITQSICENKSRLFAKNEIVKNINWNFVGSSETYLNFLIWLSIYHCSHLFRIAIFSDKISIDWAASDKSKDVSNWQIDITYALRARCVTYCFFEINANLILSLKLMIAMLTFWIN
jgi:hypothetical protein